MVLYISMTNKGRDRTLILEKTFGSETGEREIKMNL
jgi:hypothetical protein